MLARKTYSREEVDHARSDIGARLASYRRLVSAAGDGARAALNDFEPLFANSLALALDRYFVRRLRMVTGKESTPLNELELICEALMNNDGIFRGNNLVNYVPEQSVVKLEFDDPIRLTIEQLGNLCLAALAEIEEKFAEPLPMARQIRP